MNNETGNSPRRRSRRRLEGPVSTGNNQQPIRMPTRGRQHRGRTSRRNPSTGATRALPNNDSHTRHQRGNAEHARGTGNSSEYGSTPMTPPRYEPQLPPTPPFSTSPMSGYQSGSASSEDTIDQLCQEIDIQHGLIEELEEELASARSDVQDLRHQRNILETDFQNAIRYNLGRVDWLKYQVQSIGNLLDEANQRQALAEAELDKARDIARDLKKDLANAEDEQQDLKQQVKRLERKNEDLAEELTRAKDQNGSSTRHGVKRRKYISVPRGKRVSTFKIIKDIAF